MCGPEPPASCPDGCAQCTPKPAETGAWPAAYRDPEPEHAARTYDAAEAAELDGAEVTVTVQDPPPPRPRVPWNGTARW